jgi:hypothetical protein
MRGTFDVKFSKGTAFYPSATNICNFRLFLTGLILFDQLVRVISTDFCFLRVTFSAETDFPLKRCYYIIVNIRVLWVSFQLP